MNTSRLFSVRAGLLWLYCLTSICVQASPSVTSISTDGDVVHGSFVVIRGAGFDSKDQAAPVLYDFGELAYENGVKNNHQASYDENTGIARPNVDPDTLWSKPQLPGPLLTRNSSRHDHSERGYRFDGPNSFLGWPQAYGGQATPAGNEKLYVSWWYQQDLVQSKYYGTGYTDKQGVFDVGEQISIAGHPDLEAYILGDREAYTGERKLAFRVEVESANSMNSSSMQALLLTGLASGATVTLNSSYANGGYWNPRGGSSKFIRIWEENVGNVGFRLSWANMMLGVADEDGRTIAENTYTDLVPGKWHHLEIFVDLTNNIVKRWVNQVEMAQLDISQARRMEGASPTIALLGFNGKQYFNGAYGSDIYMDSTPQRVMLGNAANWNDVSHTELQRPIEWTNTSIKFETFLGSLSSTESLYIYVVDSDGNMNTEGYPFIEGKSPPMPPTFRYTK